MRLKSAEESVTFNWIFSPLMTGGANLEYFGKNFRSYISVDFGGKSVLMWFVVERKLYVLALNRSCCGGQ